MYRSDRLRAAVRPHEPHTRAGNPRRSNRWFLPAALTLGSVVLLGLLVNHLRFELRSYALLRRFADPQASGPLLRWETHNVKMEEVTIPLAAGLKTFLEASGSDRKSGAGSSSLVRARLYSPVGVKVPGGMVVVHGIHHLGMDEPRLVSFARAVAASGLTVLTPQLDSLAEYHVDSSSIAVIGESASWLDERLGNAGVTVTGISFAGGLALFAASDSRYASHFRALVLVGAYGNLARVSRFLATGLEELPDGGVETHPPHDYGASVFIYAHLNQFFPPGDLSVAHDALRNWLWEEPEKARALLGELSPASRATMNALLERRIDQVRPHVLNAIHADAVELGALSPEGQMRNLRVPVYILHGSADNIIPPAESLWLKQDLPRQQVRTVLITPAFSHVDFEKDASVWEELQLVHFMAAVLETAN